MKAILISLLIIGLVGGLVGGGMFANFSDTETSTGNSFTSGSLNLKMWDYTDEVESQGDRSPGNAMMFSQSDMVPGEFENVTIRFKNDSTIPGSLSVAFSLTADTGTPLFSTELNVTAASYDAIPILAILTAGYGDGLAPLTIAELTGAGAPPFTDTVPYTAGETKDLAITVTFDAAATGPMGATCTISIVATLNQ
jgi:predicted ribosomally synthesized peptide with SipW-like signal peptide